MTSLEPMGTPLPVGASIKPGTIRALLEGRRGQKAPLSLSQAVGVVVPLCGELAAYHEANGLAYFHPSNIKGSLAQAQFDQALASTPPDLPRDRAYLAPELRTVNGAGKQTSSAGDARATVYGMGALLYELLTLESVGPTMQRPTELVPGLPEAVEVILGKALVADPSHRPDDLRALAQAIHHLAPGGSIAPPPADESHLDVDGEMEVDISLSMLPPPPSHMNGSSPYDMVIQAAPSSRAPDSHDELTALKARLEADKRPRWVVVKDGMDHGPFSAVELLQQIATHSFVEDDLLHDNFSKERRAIRDWDEFAPFAEHARLHRDIQAEKVAIQQVVVQEKKSTRSKALVGVLVIGALLAAMGVWFAKQQGSRDDTVVVHGDNVTNIETEGGLKIDPKKQQRSGGKAGVSVAADGTPILAGGQSCEGAVAQYNEVIAIGQKGQADITRGQYAAVLNNGSYVAACGAPSSMAVNVCAAVQNGRAVGVTVTTTPPSPGVSSCIASRVRGMSFPSNPKLDVARTTFAAE